MTPSYNCSQKTCTDPENCVTPQKTGVDLRKHRNADMRYTGLSVTAVTHLRYSVRYTTYSP